jgi:hypothetical protein
MRDGISMKDQTGPKLTIKFRDSFVHHTRVYPTLWGTPGGNQRVSRAEYAGGLSLA